MKKTYLLFLILILPFTTAEYFQTDILIRFSNSTLNVTTENPSNYLYRTNIDNLTSFQETISLSIFRERIQETNFSEIGNLTKLMVFWIANFTDLVASIEKKEAYDRIIGKKDEINEVHKGVINTIGNITQWSESESKYKACENEKNQMYTVAQIEDAKIEGAKGRTKNLWLVIAFILGYGLFYMQHMKPFEVNQPGRKSFSDLERSNKRFWDGRR